MAALHARRSSKGVSAVGSRWCRGRPAIDRPGRSWSGSRRACSSTSGMSRPCPRCRTANRRSSVTSSRPRETRRPPGHLPPNHPPVGAGVPARPTRLSRSARGAARRARAPRLARTLRRAARALPRVERPCGPFRRMTSFTPSRTLRDARSWSTLKGRNDRPASWPTLPDDLRRHLAAPARCSRRRSWSPFAATGAVASTVCVRGPLGEVVCWIDEFAAYFGQRLDALGDYLDQKHGKRR